MSFNTNTGVENAKQNINHNETAHAEMTLDDLANVLDTTIKGDKINKCIVFLAMLTAYTEADQLNVCLLGGSSTGKTYLAQEVAKYFPKEDIECIAEATKKAFKYSEDRIKTDEETGKTYVDLQRIVLLFQDMPHTDLLKELRPLLSHDSKELKYMSVNNGTSGRHQTDNVIIRGFPSVIYCTANMRINEQEATRAILLSPETNREKIEASVRIATERAINFQRFNEQTENNTERSRLKERVLFIKNQHIESVILPFDPAEIIATYRSINPEFEPKNSREIRQIISLIKAVAMLNASRRMDEAHNVIAQWSDVEAGFELWKGVAKTQGAGVAPAAYAFYWDYLVPAYIEARQPFGLTLDDVLSYCRKNGKPLAGPTLTKDILPALSESGLVFYGKIKGTDARRNYIKPLELPSNTEAEQQTQGEDSAKQRGSIDDELPTATWDGGSVRGEIDFSNMEF